MDIKRTNLTNDISFAIINNGYDFANMIKHCEDNEKYLYDDFKMGFLSYDEYLSQSKIMNNKKAKFKEEFVKRIHVTPDGSPRAIGQYGASQKFLWHTMIQGKKRITAKTCSELIEKLYNIYTKDLNYGITDFSIKNIFNLALDEKQRTEAPASTTIVRNRSTFKRLFNDEFIKEDIRDVDETRLKEYTQCLVQRIPIDKKIFVSYKGILNLIYNFAVHKHIVEKNPSVYIEQKTYLKYLINKKAKSEDKILSENEISMLQDTIWDKIHNHKYDQYYHGYCQNGYAVLFSILVGTRAGEICALKWDDVDFKKNDLHIHTQMVENRDNGHTTYHIVDFTKNEKGFSNDGRHFPLYNDLKALLSELKALQDTLNIKSEYVFCTRDGNLTTTHSYANFLLRTCKALGFSVTNNHALRMTLNSNVLINKLKWSSSERARVLGHSIETNLNHYSYALKDYESVALESLNSLSTNRNDNMN